jgi:pyruvate/2-oxoglutarate dehydrogenase complex dihydrolipoamide dehydrogenase (E3) component
MSHPERFEILVLGSGAGGKLLAWHMARAGRRTAVVERRYIGGSCPNINCMPSKNEIWSAKVSHLVRHAARFGTSITGSATVDRPEAAPPIVATLSRATVAGRGGVISSSSCDRDPDHLP